MAQIFISYSRCDQTFAQHLSDSLQKAGLDIWIDLKDIHAGSKWSEIIQQALDHSQAMIVIISPESMDSENVRDEWQYFLDHDKPVIPVLLKPAKIHFQLNRIQYIDFHNQLYADAFVILCEQLEHILAIARLHRPSNVTLTGRSSVSGIFRSYRRTGTFVILLLLLGLVIKQSILPEPPTLLTTPAAPTQTLIPEVLTQDDPTGSVFPADFQVTIMVPFALLRAGPGVQFEALATALKDETFSIIGQAPGFNADDESITWYLIKHTSGRQLWISSEITRVISGADDGCALILIGEGNCGGGGNDDTP